MLEKLKKNVHMSGGTSIEFPHTQMEMTDKINELCDVANELNTPPKYNILGKCEYEPYQHLTCEGCIIGAHLMGSKDCKDKPSDPPAEVGKGLHLCKQSPCPVEYKEAADMLNNGFAASYAKDPTIFDKKPIRTKEEIVEEIYLKSGKREQAHQLLREYALSCVPEEDAHDNRRADTWNECREEMLKNIHNQP